MYKCSTRYQLRTSKKGEIYTRAIHCHCVECRNHSWNNCQLITNGLEVAKWRKQDITLVAKNNNEDFKNTFEFYKESKWILKDDLVIVLLLLHSETYHEIYMFGKLNNFPQKYHERTKSIIFRLKDKNFKIQILKDEYYVDVTLLTQDGQVGNNFKQDDQLLLPLSCVCLSEKEYNNTCKNYINAKYLEATNDKPRIKVSNIRKFEALLKDSDDNDDDD